MRARLAGLALVASLAGCATGGCPVEGGPPWRELTSPHFVLRTSLGSAAARASLERLEQTQAALLAAAWPGTEAPSARTLVVEPEDLSRFVPRTIGGFYAFGGAEDFIAIGQPRSGSFSRPGPGSWDPVVAHELAHRLARSLLPRQPRWLAEGLASYLETVRVDERAGVAVLGEVGELWARARQRYAAVADVLTWGEQPLDLADGESMERFYATSWLLVHYLVNEHEAGFAELQRRLGAAEEPGAALAAALPELARLDLTHELGRYSRYGTFRVKVVPLPRAATPATERALSAAEAHVEHARLLAFGGDLARVRAEIDRALALDPSSPAAGLLLARWVPPEEALPRARAIAAAHPDDPRAMLALGTVLPPATAERLAALERAAALGRDDGNALDAAARELLLQGLPRRALPLAARAVFLRPFDAQVVETFAHAAAAVGRCAEAVRAERRAIDLLPEQTPPEVRARLAQRLQAYVTACARQARPP